MISHMRDNGRDLPGLACDMLVMISRFQFGSWITAPPFVPRSWELSMYYAIPSIDTLVRQILSAGKVFMVATVRYPSWISPSLEITSVAFSARRQVSWSWIASRSAAAAFFFFFLQDGPLLT